jgi:hypothetical protein
MKISQLPQDATPTTDDYVSGVDNGTIITKRFSVANLITTIFNNIPTLGLPSQKLNNPYRFSVYMSATQSTVATTWTRLNMNSELYDISNNYSTSTFGYTAPMNGYYQFILSAQLLSQAATPYILAIGINTTNSETYRIGEIPNTTGNITINGTVEVLLNAGDVVYPLYYSVTASKTINNPNSVTYFMGKLTSAL